MRTSFPQPGDWRLVLAGSSGMKMTPKLPSRPSQSPDLSPIENLWRELKPSGNQENQMYLQSLCEEDFGQSTSLVQTWWPSIKKVLQRFSTKGFFHQLLRLVLLGDQILILLNDMQISVCAVAYEIVTSKTGMRCATSQGLLLASKWLLCIKTVRKLQEGRVSL